MNEDLSGTNTPEVDSIGREQRRRRVLSRMFGTTSDPVLVSDYVLLDKLGEGGMGVVHAAYDRKLDRKVALKILSVQHKPELRARLQREAKAMAKLAHPNVVQVFDVGEFAGTTFIAMEHVDGQTLREWAAAQDRSLSEILAMYICAGQGLQAVHDAGMVHRDFKPDNVMVRSDGRVLVMDFGLAGGDLAPTMPEFADDGDTAVITRTGEIVGTPVYMAPEQWSGFEVGAATDQFAFCVSLWEALYKARPFTGATLKAVKQAVLVGTVTSTESKSVPSWVREILLRGLSVEPKNRYRSMSELLGALAMDPRIRNRRIMAAVGLVVGLGLGAWGLLQVDAHVCQGFEDDLAGVWDDSRRAQVEASILATKLSYAPDTWSRVSRSLDDYTTTWVEHRTSTCEATHRGVQSPDLLDRSVACLDNRLLDVRLLVDSLSEANATRVENAVRAISELESIEQCTDANALLAEHAPPADPRVAARAHDLRDDLALAKTRLELGEFDEGLPIADRVVREAELLGYPPLQTEAWLVQGLLLQELGNFEGARSAYAKSYDVAVSAWMRDSAASSAARMIYVLGVNLDDSDSAVQWSTHVEPMSRGLERTPIRALYLYCAGAALFVGGKHEEARAKLEQALELEQQDGTELRLMSLTLTNLGRLLDDIGEYDAAQEHLETALELKIQLFGSRHPLVAITHDQLGNLAIALGRWDEARAHLDEALLIKETALGTKHVRVADTLSYLGILTSQQRDFESARVYHERARQIIEDLYGPDSPKLVHALGNLGTIALQTGDLDPATAYFDRVLSIQERTLDENHPDLATTIANIGVIAASRGNYDEALANFERALAVDEKAYGPTHVQVGRGLHNLGMLARQFDDYPSARDYFRRSLAIYEQALGPEHPEVSAPLFGLGQAMHELGQAGDAVSYLERALEIEERESPAIEVVAETRFALSRALWEAPTIGGRDRTRALALAEAAREGFAEAGDGQAEYLAQVEAWLAAHR